MKQYHNLILNTLKNGTYKENRTAVDTISTFSQHYKIDIDEDNFPILTTKDLSGYRWESLIHELIWYLSGEEHIRNLREKTKIWNAWANENGELDTAYGRFWRNYPAAKKELPGEAWADDDHKWTNEDGTFDQIQYIIDQLNNNPQTRRLVLNAWHPNNAAVSQLPPCHYTAVFNIQGDRLNCHLTQRSGDIALGIPFNIAAYSILTLLLAKQTGFEPGELSHEIVDAHIYCGTGKRAKWYKDNLETLKKKITPSETNISNSNKFITTKEWIKNNAPSEKKENKRKDHIPGLLEQLSRTPKEKPKLEVSNTATVDNLDFNDINLSEYNPHEGITFNVAE